jgi:hypothetical protein
MTLGGSPDPPRKRLGLGQESVPFDAFGKSGGAIFGLPVIGLNGVMPGRPSTLVGFPTRWERAQYCIKGPSIAVLIRLLDELVR